MEEIIKTIIEFIDWSQLTTIGLGLFAGLIALYKVKNTIRLNARLKWIDDLRDLTGLYATSLNSHLAGYKLKTSRELVLKEEGKDPLKDEQYLTNFYNPSFDEVKKLELYYHKFLMYLNPLDEMQKESLTILSDLNDIVSSEMTAKDGFNQDRANKKVSPKLNDLIRNMGKIFNREQKKI